MPIAGSDFRALGNLEAAPTGSANPKCTETKLKLNGFRLPSQKTALADCTTHAQGFKEKPSLLKEHFGIGSNFRLQ